MVEGAWGTETAGDGGCRLHYNQSHQQNVLCNTISLCDHFTMDSSIQWNILLLGTLQDSKHKSYPA